MKNGFHPDMPYDEYRTDEAVAKSDLDLVNESPAQLIWRKNAPVDTRVDNAGIFGTAFHTAVLEPDKYKSDYIEAPKIDKRTKAGKEEYAEFLAMSEYHIVLSNEEAETIKLMRESVFAHPIAREIIESAEYFESSIFYEDKPTGVQCKCRPDIISTKLNVIADLKSTKAITKWLYRDVLDYRYHIQDVHYSTGYETYFGEKPIFLFIFVSKERTFGQYRVKVIRLRDDFINAAQDERHQNLKTIQKCRETGEYNGIEYLSLGG